MARSFVGSMTQLDITTWLKIPAAILVFGFLFIELGLYVTIRSVVTFFEQFRLCRRKAPQLRRKVRTGENMQTYEEWERAANHLDIIDGRDDWKHDPSVDDDEYNYKLVQKLLLELQSKRKAIQNALISNEEYYQHDTTSQLVSPSGQRFTHDGAHTDIQQQTSAGLVRSNSHHNSRTAHNAPTPSPVPRQLDLPLHSTTHRRRNSRSFPELRSRHRLFSSDDDGIPSANTDDDSDTMEYDAESGKASVKSFVQQPSASSKPLIGDITNIAGRPLPETLVGPAKAATDLVNNTSELVSNMFGRLYCPANKPSHRYSSRHRHHRRNSGSYDSGRPHSRPRSVTHIDAYDDDSDSSGNGNSSPEQQQPQSALAWFADLLNPDAKTNKKDNDSDNDNDSSDVELIKPKLSKKTSKSLKRRASSSSSTNGITNKDINNSDSDAAGASDATDDDDDNDNDDSTINSPTPTDDTISTTSSSPSQQYHYYKGLDPLDVDLRSVVMGEPASNAARAAANAVASIASLSARPSPSPAYNKRRLSFVDAGSSAIDSTPVPQPEADGTILALPPSLDKDLLPTQICPESQQLLQPQQSYPLYPESQYDSSNNIFDEEKYGPSSSHDDSLLSPHSTTQSDVVASSKTSPLLYPFQPTQSTPESTFHSPLSSHPHQKQSNVSTKSGTNNKTQCELDALVASTPAPPIPIIQASPSNAALPATPHPQQDGIQPPYDEEALQDLVLDLTHVVQLCLRPNVAGISEETLYSQTNTGTKDLITAFVYEIGTAIDYISSLDILSDDSILDILLAFRRTFGNNTLSLSGGGGNGSFHWGVLQALLEDNAIPGVVSGTSAGSLAAAHVCCRTVDELKESLKPELLAQYMKFDNGLSHWGKFKHWLQNGYMLDPDGWVSMLKWHCMGDMTFAEAYAKTGRVLVITATSPHPSEPPLFLSYLTSPNIIIWSAIMASSSLPMLFPNVSLLQKNPSTGKISTNTTVFSELRDGSFKSDIPTNELSFYFNASYTIVSQVNPHIAIFYYNAKGDAGRSVASWGGYRGGWALSFLEMYLKYDMVKLLNLADRMRLYPFRFFGADLGKVFVQHFSGHVTLVPSISIMNYLKLATAPTADEMAAYMQEGRLMVWRKKSLLLTRLLISQALTRCIDKIEKKIASK